MFESERSARPIGATSSTRIPARPSRSSRLRAIVAICVGVATLSLQAVSADMPLVPESGIPRTHPVATALRWCQSTLETPGGGTASHRQKGVVGRPRTPSRGMVRAEMEVHRFGASSGGPARTAAMTTSLER